MSRWELGRLPAPRTGERCQPASRVVPACPGLRPPPARQRRRQQELPSEPALQTPPEQVPGGLTPKMGSGTKGELAAHLAADVLSILSGRYRVRGCPALHNLPAWDFGVHRGAAAPTECRVGCAVGTWRPAPTRECLSHPITALAIPHSNEGKLRQAPQRGVPARGGVAPGSVAASGSCSCAWGVRGWVGAGGVEGCAEPPPRAKTPPVCPERGSPGTPSGSATKGPPPPPAPPAPQPHGGGGGDGRGA